MDTSEFSSLGSKLEDILVLLPKYETLLEESAPCFDIEGKKIESLCRDHPKWIAKYAKIDGELKALLNLLESERASVEGKLWKKYVEGYSRQLSSTDIKNYISAEKEMVAIARIAAEVSLVKNNSAAVLDALKDMGWTLKYVVELRINQMKDEIIS